MKRNLWAVGFAMLVLGLLLTTQYRVTQVANAPKAVDLRAEDLSRELAAAKAKLQALERSNLALKAEIDQLATAGGGNQVEVPVRDVKLELWAGTAPAKGKGLILTVAPATGRNVIIQDNDLWYLMNELWAAGAEGIAINRQRLTAVSEIRQLSRENAVMIINQFRTSAPFEVDVVGDPEALETALKKQGGAVPRLAQFGIRVQVIRSERVELPAYGSPPEFRFLSPVL